MLKGLIPRPGAVLAVDAIATSATLSATYRRYLRSLLPVRDKALAAALAECIAASPMLTSSKPRVSSASQRLMCIPGNSHRRKFLMM